MKTPLERIPPEARGITALGNRTLAAVQKLYEGAQGELFDGKPNFDVRPISDALASGWTDESAAELIANFTSEIRRSRTIDTGSLARWIRHHPNDPAAVQDCMRVTAPDEVEIIKVLSRKGSQKLVYLAKWLLTLQEVVLKRLLTTQEKAERIIARELQSSPLSMVHPNIIETHFLQNNEGERFLVEKRLNEVLHDEWSSHGIYEAANLLYDIGRAIHFLHQHKLVHGDLKPDNIGKKGPSYVLLDFGICRPRDQLLADATATGSLRTRAPELLANNSYLHPEKADVWALGATIFKVVTGRYPLTTAGEHIPRISTPQDRHKFESLLRTRAESEWDKWVDLTLVPHPLNELLRRTLQRDPESRIDTQALITSAQHELSAFIRSTPSITESGGRFSPLDELRQIEFYVSNLTKARTSIPVHKRLAIRSRLEQIKGIQGFQDIDNQRLTDLVRTLAQ